MDVFDVVGDVIPSGHHVLCNLAPLKHLVKPQINVIEWYSSKYHSLDILFSDALDGGIEAVRWAVLSSPRREAVYAT